MRRSGAPRREYYRDPEAKKLAHGSRGGACIPETHNLSAVEQFNAKAALKRLGVLAASASRSHVKLIRQHPTTTSHVGWEHPTPP